MKRPSCEYYSFARLPYGTYEKVSAVYDLFEALTQIPYQVTEPSVAHQKCQFYQNDILKMHALTATHPLCIALQQKQGPCDLAAWQPIITATQMDIDRMTFYTDADFERYAHKKYGALYALVSRCLSNDVNTDACDALGLFIAQVIRLQRFRVEAIEQNHIPLSLFTKHHLEQWNLEQNEGPVQPLLTELINDALEQYDADTALPKPLKQLNRLYHDILLVMKKDPAGLMTRWIDTSALKKFFVSRCT